MALEAGQMVTWGMRWWHRVEVAPTGVSVGISTRGYGMEKRCRRVLYEATNRAIGEVEHYFDALDEDPPIRNRAQLEALVRLVTGQSDPPDGR
jgi:hypothetical protein